MNWARCCARLHVVAHWGLAPHMNTYSRPKPRGNQLAATGSMGRREAGIRSLRSRALPIPDKTAPDFAAIHEQKQRRRQVTLQLLGEEYSLANPEGYSLLRSPVPCSSRGLLWEAGTSYGGYEAQTRLMQYSAAQ